MRKSRSRNKVSDGEPTDAKPRVPVPSLLVGASLAEPEDEAGNQRYPCIAELMNPINPSTGPCRLPGSLQMRWEGSTLELSITMPSEGLMVSWTTDSLIDVLDRFEAFLASKSYRFKPSWERSKVTRRKGKWKAS